MGHDRMVRLLAKKDHEKILVNRLGISSEKYFVKCSWGKRYRVVTEQKNPALKKNGINRLLPIMMYGTCITTVLQSRSLNRNRRKRIIFPRSEPELEP
jgi:hypothetical protein